MSEPRTTADIMADLLEFAERHEWSDLIHTGGDYHEKGCRDCGATEDVRVKGHLCGEHAPDCNRWRLLEEARAFIRVERSTAAPAHTDGDTCPSCSEVLGSPSVCAISHDFRPGAYDGATVTTTPGHTWQRDASGGSELVPAPVDVPHDLREAAMARWAPPPAPVATAEPWAPQVGDRVVTAEKLTASTSSWPAPDGYVQRRRPGVSGRVLFPGDAPDMWWIHHDGDGCTAPYDVAEIAPAAPVATGETKPGASCPDCHEDCIGWVVDGNQCGGAP